MTKHILPEDYQILFHLRCDETYEVKGETISAVDVFGSLTWICTAEGGIFWLNVWEWLIGERGNLPSIPPQSLKEIEFAKAWCNLKS